jgi:Tol biopolymer transport system component
MNNLTNSAADDRAPAWSPDGTKIAFVRRGDIFVMDADGSNPTNLTYSQSMDNQGPAWSPDGTRIAFSSAPNAPNSTNRDIFTLEVTPAEE